MAYDLKHELRQDLKLGQQLVMTPQLQLAIRLLQLSRMELVEAVRHELDENPVLEEEAAAEGGEGGDGEAAADPDEYSSDQMSTSTETPAAEEPAAQEMDWESYLADYESFRPVGKVLNDDENDRTFDNISTAPETLKDYLTEQLGGLNLDEDDYKLGLFIIGNIDDDGYLRFADMTATDSGVCEEAVIQELTDLTGVGCSDVRRVLLAVQGFDPAGVGARDVRESLLIQVSRLCDVDPVVGHVIEGHLDKLAARGYKAIAKALDIPIERVFDAARFITASLNPMPGSGFGPDTSRAVIPDIYVHKVGGDYVVSLNDDGMPKLKVSSYYRRLLKDNGALSGDAKGYVQERLRSALWLIKSVHQRQRTIFRVTESIVKFQREFLEKGLKCLKPLVLKDVAEDIGVHESTVSRVTTNKYVHTPRGILDLKYFFTSAMSGTDGTAVTSEYIKVKVRDLIEGEDALKPMSDQQIVDRLKEQGIVLARRTAMKYREELGYGSSSARKSYF